MSAEHIRIFAHTVFLPLQIYPDGNLSQHLDKMKVGEELKFKHIPFNVKRQYPFGKKNVAMIAGGTGIAPMIQALHAVLGNNDDDTAVTILYGSQKSDQILAQQLLDEWTVSHGDQLKVTHVLSREPEGSAWQGERGFVNKELISKYVRKRLSSIYSRSPCLHSVSDLTGTLSLAGTSPRRLRTSRSSCAGRRPCTTPCAGLARRRTSLACSLNSDTLLSRSRSSKSS